MSLKYFTFFLVLLLITFSQVWIIDACPLFSDAEQTCETKECKAVADSILRNMDDSVDPCQDFYSYVCGNYVKTTRVEKGYGWNDGFTNVGEEVKNRIKDILEGHKYEDRFPPIVFAKRMYWTCMNDTDDLETIRSYLREFVPQAYDVKPTERFRADFLAALGFMGVWPLIKVYVSPDLENPEASILVIAPGEPMSTASFSVHLDELYDAYIENISKAIDPVSPLDAYERSNMTRLEKDISFLLRSDLASQDESNSFTKTTIHDLQEDIDQYAKSFDWLDILSRLIRKPNMTGSYVVAVTDMTYLRRLAKLLTAFDTKTIVDYMIWRFVYTAVGDSFGELEEIENNFLTLASGATISSMARDDTCVAKVDNGFRFLLSAIYVNEFFSPEAKKQVEAMGRELLATFVKRIENTYFMDEFAKKAAISKVNNMAELIGYPDWILNDTYLNTLFESYPSMNFTQLENQFVLITKSIVSSFSALPDRYPGNGTYEESTATPETQNKTRTFDILPIEVNAEYNRPQNKITIPAGILQLPFYQYGLPSAYNFGAIGFSIGHEITHGFDNLGRKYDSYGSLRPWWSDAVVESFDEEASCFENQYRHYCMIFEGKFPNETSSYCVRSIFTLAENIADNGGLETAFQAWKNHNDTKGENRKLPGLEYLKQDQLFFVAMANPWCAVYTKIGFLDIILANEHAPNMFRVNAALSNSPEFAKAFQCPAGLMNRQDDRCKIW